MKNLTKLQYVALRKQRKQCTGTYLRIEEDHVYLSNMMCLCLCVCVIMNESHRRLIVMNFVK